MPIPEKHKTQWEKLGEKLHEGNKEEEVRLRIALLSPESRGWIENLLRLTPSTREQPTWSENVSNPFRRP